MSRQVSSCFRGHDGWLRSIHRASCRSLARSSRWLKSFDDVAGPSHSLSRIDLAPPLPCQRASLLRNKTISWLRSNACTSGPTGRGTTPSDQPWFPETLRGVDFLLPKSGAVLLSQKTRSSRSPSAPDPLSVPGLKSTQLPDRPAFCAHYQIDMHRDKILGRDRISRARKGGAVYCPSIVQNLINRQIQFGWVISFTLSDDDVSLFEDNFSSGRAAP